MVNGGSLFASLVGMRMIFVRVPWTRKALPDHTSRVKSVSVRRLLSNACHVSIFRFKWGAETSTKLKFFSPFLENIFNCQIYGIFGEPVNSLVKTSYFDDF